MYYERQLIFSLTLYPKYFKVLTTNQFWFFFSKSPMPGNAVGDEDLNTLDMTAFEKAKKIFELSCNKSNKTDKNTCCCIPIPLNFCPEIHFWSLKYNIFILSKSEVLNWHLSFFVNFTHQLTMKILSLIFPNFHWLGWVTPPPTI